jgi:hypothetical protein
MKLFHSISYWIKYIALAIYYLDYIHRPYQGYFCDGTRRNAVPEALSQKDASRNDVPEPFFFPVIDILSLGMSCYLTALFSNKLASRPLKFERVTANNSLDFVQFLKKIPPPPSEIWGTLCVPEPIFFFIKIALVLMFCNHYVSRDGSSLVIR